MRARASAGQADTRASDRVEPGKTADDADEKTAPAAPAAEAKPEKGCAMQVFGQTPEGKPVHLFTLTNANGMQARIMNYGAAIVQLRVPDRDGRLDDVVLGFDALEPYLGKHPFFGVAVGRYANRIGNARFTLDGKTYSVDKNWREHHLHGGEKGFHAKLWDASTTETARGVAVELRCLSPDGESGFPGNLQTTIRYTLADNDELAIEYTAQTDKPTPVNLTNHSYFNLTGMKEDILGHVVSIDADRVTAVNADLIPIGTLEAVAGTPLDLRKPATIGSRIVAVEGGYDHNYIINKPEGKLTRAATAHDPASGRMMEVWTTEPAVQLYTGNHLANVAGKGGQIYNKHAGLCFEAQHYPDSPNHPEFPNTILRPGEEYVQTTIYRFSVK